MLVEGGGHARTGHAQLHAVHTDQVVNALGQHRDQVIVLATEDDAVMKVDIAGFLVIGFTGLHRLQMRIEQSHQVGDFVVAHVFRSQPCGHALERFAHLV